MQIQGMIPAAVIMGVTPGSSVVPQAFELRHRLGPFQIHIIQEAYVCLLAVIFPVDIYLQGFVQQILFGCHNVYDIPKCFRVVTGRIHMDMDTTAIVDFGSTLTKFPYQ
jgi:hypothetical protein